MSWHPTRRDILLVLIVITLFSLFLQLDLSFRFTDSKGSDSLLGFKLGIGGRTTWEQTRNGRKHPGAAGVGSEYSSTPNGGAAVSDAKLKWEEGAALRTEVVTHAPGWTVFDNIYLFNGTWYIVTDDPSAPPLLRMMVSTGAEIWNDEDSIRSREPTEKDMRIVFPSEAKRLWGRSASLVGGVTFLVNDPPQFLDHYYHFAAELLFGLWRTYASLDPSINALGETQLPAPSRLMMPHVPAGKWNDYAKMNSFLTRAIFPSMAYEYQSDFLDRADTQRAFLYERIVFADRAAAFRGPEFSKTWRTASEAVTLQGSRYWWSPVRRNLLEFVGIGLGGVDEIDLEAFGVGVDLGVAALEEHGFDADALDEPQFIRRRSVQDVLPVALEDHGEIVEEQGFAGTPEEIERRRVAAVKRDANLTETPEPPVKHAPGAPVITYVSRQDWGRRMLRRQDHETLVKELRALEKKHGWEVHIVAMDKLTRDEQIRLAARTTIMMGVHGNGLTHLIWMNNLNPRSTVMEFFYPGGFAEDYEFTSRALGLRHYGWWGDQSFTAPNTPEVAYPEGFQGNDIPLNGKAVAQLVEQRLLVDKAGAK